MQLSPRHTKVTKRKRLPWADSQSMPSIQPAPWLKPSVNRSSHSAVQAKQRQTTGFEGEQHALIYLQNHNLQLVARNVRCRQGEIDLIVREGETAVVVEVRVRKQASHGTAAESITSNKRARITKAARWWWHTEGQRQFKFLRFDVVVFERDGQPHWIQQAWRMD